MRLIERLRASPVPADGGGARPSPPAIARLPSAERAVSLEFLRDYCDFLRAHGAARADARAAHAAARGRAGAPAAAVERVSARALTASTGLSLVESCHLHATPRERRVLFGRATVCVKASA